MRPKKLCKKKKTTRQNKNNTKVRGRSNKKQNKTKRRDKNDAKFATRWKHKRQKSQKKDGWCKNTKKNHAIDEVKKHKRCDDNKFYNVLHVKKK